LPVFPHAHLIRTGGTVRVFILHGVILPAADREKCGSYSIESVLPAVFPDDPDLDYHNLEGVHNGGEAMTIFPQIQYMEPQAQEAARHNLLKYCELDTYAMVKLWQELVRVATE